MRILDEDHDRAITSVLLMLTPTEARELSDMLRALTSEPGDHVHVSDQKFSRTVTVAIYTPENLRFFDDRARRLVETGE